MTAVSSESVGRQPCRHGLNAFDPVVGCRRCLDDQMLAKARAKKFSAWDGPAISFETEYRTCYNHARPYSYLVHKDVRQNTPCPLCCESTKVTIAQVDLTMDEIVRVLELLEFDDIDGPSELARKLMKAGEVRMFREDLGSSYTKYMTGAKRTGADTRSVLDEI